MKENILNLPHHLRRLRFIYSEQAAMAMVGEYNLYFLREMIGSNNQGRWHAASCYHQSMRHAVQAGQLNSLCDIPPLSVSTLQSYVFAPNDIWTWALEELSDNSPWYGASNDIVPALPCVETVGAVNNHLVPYGYDAQNPYLLNAGLTKLLVDQSGSKYLRGGSPNISALARDVADVVASALPPSEPDKTESFRKFISESRRRLPLLK